MVGPRLLLALLLLGAPSWAGPAETARQLYSDGVRQVDLRNFDAAIEFFKDAYKLAPAPGLLFNIAQTYRLKGDWEQAIAFYRNYLRNSPRAANRADVDGFIARCEAEVAARQKAAAAKAERERLDVERLERERQKERTQRLRLEQELAEATRLARERELAATLKKNAPPPVYRRWWPWTLAVGVVAVGGVGAGLGAAYGGPVIRPMGSLETIDGR